MNASASRGFTYCGLGAVQAESPSTRKLQRKQGMEEGPRGLLQGAAAAGGQWSFRRSKKLKDADG